MCAVQTCKVALAAVALAPVPGSAVCVVMQATLCTHLYLQCVTVSCLVHTMDAVSCTPAASHAKPALSAAGLQASSTGAGRLGVTLLARPVQTLLQPTHRSSTSARATSMQTPSTRCARLMGWREPSVRMHSLQTAAR